MGAKPLLLIHAGGDEQIPPDASERLYANARQTPQADPAAGWPSPILPPSTTRNSTGWR